MSMTSDQKKAYDLCEAWLSATNHSKTRFMKLRAPGGTGKSWLLVNHLIPLFNTHSMEVAYTASSHEACASLRREFEASSQEAANVSTIHSFLGCSPASGPVSTNPKPFINSGYRMGYDTFLSSTVDLIVIDEAFRLDEKLIEIGMYLYPHTKFLFIYDPYQTRPINSVSPMDSQLTGTSYIAELSQTPRFKDAGEIGELCYNLRLAVQHQDTDYRELLPIKDSGNVRVVPATELRNALKTRTSQGASFPVDRLCILTGTREYADSLNYFILKERAVSGQSVLLHENESVAIEYQIGTPASAVKTIWSNNGLGEVLTSDKVASVKSCFAHLCGSPHLKEYLQPILKMGTPILLKENDTFIMLMAGNGGKPLSSDQLKRLWAFHRECGYSFVFVRATIAKTIHSAQGVTSNCVFVDLKSIYAWGSNHEDMRRLLYTGCSRSSNLLNLMVR